MPVCASSALGSASLSHLRTVSITVVAVSTVLKPSDGRLDLGRTDGRAPTYVALRESCVAGRVPPVLPRDAEHQILHVKHFTSGGDRRTVVQIYASFFNAVRLRLRRLRLHSLGWGDDQAEKLVEAMYATCPRRPFLRATTQLSLACSFHRHEFSGLEELDFHGNTVGDEGIRKLLEWLRGSQTLVMINGMSVAKLRGDDGTDAIDLSRSSLRRALDALDVAVIGTLIAKNPSLTSLDLSGNLDLGDRAGTALALSLRGNVALTALNLSGTGIGDVGGEALFKALAGHNAHLASVVASGNAIGSRSIAAVAAALFTNSALRTVDVSDSKARPSPKAVALLADALRANTTLATLSALSSASYWPKLRGDDVAGADEMHVGGGDDLPLGAEDALLIAALVGTHRAITVFSLVGVPSMGKPGGDAFGLVLKQHERLMALSIKGCALGDAGCAAIAKGLSARMLPQHLTELDLSDNQIARLLPSHPLLAYLRREDCSLRRLCLSQNELGNDGVEALGAALDHSSGVAERNGSIRVLEIKHVAFGQRGAQQLASALRTNATIELINATGLRAFGGGRGSTFTGRQSLQQARQRREQVLKAIEVLQNGELLKSRVKLDDE